ncbi:MAG: nucleotidyltransferase family protein [Desulfovibrio sp.]|nr:nucleotidyltransferase family protein [Desulfovibrio sp.]
MDRLPENAALRRLVAKLYGTHLTARDQCLLDFRFAKAPTQDMLDECLAQCDIEAMGGNKCILLAYARREHPELVFSDYAGPRIDGLIRYFHFANTKTLAHFSKIGKALNQAGIPILLFKGAAMRALRPELPRPMGDADILIPAGRIDEATRIGEGLGYLHTREESNHAVDFHTEAESAVDVHHSIFDPDRDYTAFHKGLFERAKPATVFGVDVLLPSREDLCFLVMANLTKNLREHTTLHSIYFSIEDCAWLQRDTPLNWDIIREDAVASGHEVETSLAAAFMNAAVPGLFPEPEELFPELRGVEDFCNLVIFDEDYFLPRQRHCQSIRVVELKNDPWRHGSRILKFLLLKKLRGYPAFVRWYLAHKRGIVTHAF